MAAYANSSSTVSVGNANNNATAAVAGTHQLETTLAAPNNVVLTSTGIAAHSAGRCTPRRRARRSFSRRSPTIWAPARREPSFALLANAACGAVYDYADTVQAYEAQSHTFPTGLPITDVSVRNYSPSGSTLHKRLLNSRHAAAAKASPARWPG